MAMAMLVRVAGQIKGIQKKSLKITTGQDALIPLDLTDT